MDNKTGNERKTCPFEEKFNEEYGMRASTLLTHTLSTLGHATKAVRSTATVMKPVATVTAGSHFAKRNKSSVLI